jgi:hypothetical protein
MSLYKQKSFNSQEEVTVYIDQQLTDNVIALTSSDKISARTVKCAIFTCRTDKVYVSVENTFTVYEFDDISSLITSIHEIGELTWAVVQVIFNYYKVIFLHTSAFHNMLRQTNPIKVEQCRWILKQVESGNVTAMLSVQSLFDLLDLAKTDELRERIYLLITKFKNLTMVPIDEEIVKSADKYRREQGKDLTESIICATYDSIKESNPDILYFEI